MVLAQFWPHPSTEQMVHSHSADLMLTTGPVHRSAAMKPETVGMSTLRLARLEQVMKHRYVDGGYLPGMQIHVWRRGQLVHTSLCRQMDLERGRPMRETWICIP